MVITAFVQEIVEKINYTKNRIRSISTEDK